MKICFLIEDISLGGGGERVVSLLSNYFKEKKKRDVIIITCKKEKQNLNYEFKSKIINLNLEYKHTKINKLIFWIKASFKLRKYLKSENVVMIGIGLEMNIILSLLNKKIKKIGCEHTSYNSQSKFMKIIRKICYKNLNRIVSLTNYDLKFYKMINKNSIVIQNPLTYPPIKINNLLKKEKVVCLVGRLSKEKQFDKILYLINNIKEKCLDWKFEIYGTGVEENKLKEIIKKLKLEEKISLMGNVRDLDKKLVKKSIFILCSKYEGLPMVLLESLSCRLACVSFNCETGPEEIIKNGINGILVTNQNFKELEKKILFLIENSKFRMKLQKNSDMYLDKFKLETIIKKWEEVLERV